MAENALQQVWFMATPSVREMKMGDRNAPLVHRQVS
jgi:hypothetical protein